MKISVVTVCYNSAATILDTLHSVNAQSHGDVEHVIVDGGSSDLTMELVRRHGRRLGAGRSGPDQGIYDAMNHGLGLATGEVVGFLNSDDMYADAGSLARVAEAFADPSVEACYGDLVYVSSRNTDRVLRYWKSRPHEPGLCGRGWMPAHPTFYVRRRVLERVGHFDLSFRIAADFEFCLRTLDVHRVTARYIPEVLVRMRAGGASNASLRNVLQANREAARAARMHGYPGGLAFFARKLFPKLVQLVRRGP